MRRSYSVGALYGVTCWCYVLSSWRIYLHTGVSEACVQCISDISSASSEPIPIWHRRTHSRSLIITHRVYRVRVRAVRPWMVITEWVRVVLEVAEPPAVGIYVTIEPPRTAPRSRR